MNVLVRIVGRFLGGGGGKVTEATRCRRMVQTAAKVSREVTIATPGIVHDSQLHGRGGDESRETSISQP